LPSGKRHYRLTLADALSAHERALQTGGLSGIPNIGLVESAIVRPYNGHYRPIACKAAALLQSISTNHGFADGNKRTAIILIHLFLSRSGYKIVPFHNMDGPLDVVMEELVLSVVRRELTFAQLVEWFKKRLHRL
jgi:death on curing protein